MAEKSSELNSSEHLRPLLREGEVFITNASRESELFVVKIDDEGKIRFEREEAGSQLAEELASGGGWESIRVLEPAFDKDGKPIEGMVALVGTKKKEE